MHIGHSQEVVCLGQSDTLLAAGSHSHTTLIDPRIEQPIKDIVSLEEEHGTPCQHKQHTPHPAPQCLYA